MAKMEDQNIIVHVYNATMQHTEHKFYTEEIAKLWAHAQFKKEDVYKVKVWDLTKGPIEPNRTRAKGLILHLV